MSLVELLFSSSASSSLVHSVGYVYANWINGGVAVGGAYCIRNTQWIPGLAKDIVERLVVSQRTAKSCQSTKGVRAVEMDFDKMVDNF